MGRRSLTALVVLLAVVTACGGQDDTTTTTVAETTTTVVDGGGVDEARTDATNTVRSFMAARRDGSGAEQFLTAEGAEVYPERISLYDVAVEEVGELRLADASSYEATVVVTDDEGGTRTELIFVGPGEVDGEPVDFAVRGGVVDDG